MRTDQTTSCVRSHSQCQWEQGSHLGNQMMDGGEERGEAEQHPEPRGWCCCRDGAGSTGMQVVGDQKRRLRLL